MDLRLGGVRGVVVDFGWFLLLGGGGLGKVFLFVLMGGKKVKKLGQKKF